MADCFLSNFSFTRTREYNFFQCGSKVGQLSLALLFSELVTRYKEHMRRVTRLQRDADVDLKHYKHFDRLEQLREMVRLRLSLATGTSTSN